METHVSSTTAGVPETQEVIGSNGNVEMVIVVEKVEEDQQQKVDSNSEGNGQPMVEGHSPVSVQTTNKDGLLTSPSKRDQLQESVGKEINQSKITQHSSKILSSKLSDSQTSQNKWSDKQVGNVTPSMANKDPSTTTTSQKDDTMDENESDEVDNKDITLNITVERDFSNNPQTEMSGDASEKEHNKSISRELKSLINSAKESKIISECTKLTTKTRKSRAALDMSSTSVPNTPESDSIQGKRRSSSNSQKSNSSEKSDKVAKRSMRSQNPEFVHKVKKFLNSVTGKFQRGADSDASSGSDEEMVAIKNKQNTSDSVSSTSNRNLNAEQVQSKIDDKNNKLRSDPYCWRCHWSNDMMDEEKTPQPPLNCTVCPRAFHFRCLTGTERTKIVSEKNWVCPECMIVLHAESSESRSSAMKKTSLGMLCELLKYALQRMTEVNGAEPFLQPVDRTVFPDYDKYVVHPMDLSLMKENISEGLYGSTEAFLADSYWILHNSIIFNTLQSKLTTVARALVRSCRAEMCEIEACPECYAAAHARRPTWFTDVCTTPHLLLWAKLKGFPYWPAKAMSVSLAGLVDVRFFGAHDRAWVPARDCYLYSEKDPNNFRTKRQDILDSMLEAEQHIRNISRKHGKFVYAPYRVVFDAFRLEEQLKTMIPSFDGPVKSPIRDRRPKTPAPGKKSRSNSKSSKDDSNVGEILSDSEPIDVESTKNSEERDKSEPATSAGRTPIIVTRKRRRSDPKEPAGAGADASPKEKRRLVDGDGKEPPAKKPEPAAATNSKETGQKHKEPDDGAADEPIEIDSDPASPNPTQPAPNKSDAPPTRPTPSKPIVVATRITPSKPEAPATRSTPNKPDTPSARLVQNKPDTPLTRSIPNKTDAAAKTNKTAAKPNDAGVTPTKTPAKTDTAKVNDKGKSIPQEESTILQNQRNSRGNKSVTNMETIEVEEINNVNSPTGKSTKQPVNSTPKTNANTNKTSPKESVSLVNTVEKEKGVDSAVLIKINERGNSSTPNKTNPKEKLVEVATITKITDAAKNTPIKNKGKEKESDNQTNKDTTKEKATTSTPVKTTGKVNPAPSPTANKQPSNEKPNETPAKSNDTGVTVKAVELSISNNNPGQKKAKEISADKPTLSDKTVENSTDSNKNDSSADKDKNTPAKSGLSISPKPSTSKVVMATKDRIQCDDDTHLTVVAKKSSAPATVTSGSLRSVVPAAPPTTRSSVIAKTKTTQITVEVNPDSNIFTPTSTDNVRNMKEAVTKLQKLRTGLDPPASPKPNPQVGRVGVRAFARMTSPPEPPAQSNDLLVEIKSEPMEFEEAETQPEPSVLDSLVPRPVPPVPAGATLREVRISKVMPAAAVLKKPVKAPDVRPRAKKTFPQPKKPDDGRAELTNKNSMVYIPIQPPISQAPVRASLKASVHSMGPSTSMPARATTIFSTANVNGQTSMAPPLLPMAPPPPPPLPPLPTTTATVTVASSAAPVVSPMGGGPALAGAIIAASAFPTVPTTVHTVPLITSVNGQWTLSLQPVMSVGTGENMSSPTVNVVSERVVTAVVSSAPALLPPPPPPPPLPPVTAQSAFVTPTPAPAPTPVLAAPLSRVQPEPAPSEPPQLQQRPALLNPLAASTEIGEMTAPSTAGPVTAKLNQNSLKLAEFFRTLLEDSLVQLEEPAAEAAALRLQLEQARWQHQHEVAELRHTHELLLVEVRSAMDKEKTRAVAEARRLAHQELETAVKNAKSKQWCSNCGQEAQFYCCWNTSYCDYPCQRAHWAQHFSSCTQQRTGGNSVPTEQAQSMPPPEVPKTTSTLIPTGKVTSGASRLVVTEQTQAKSPVVGNMSASEDASLPGGAKTMGAVFAAPHLPNKQLMNIEECATKRMVPAGGYLIIGTGAAVGPPPRRD